MSSHTAKKRKLSPSENDHTEHVDTGPNGMNGFHNAKAGGVHRVVSMNDTTERTRTDRSAELALASGLYKSSFFKLQTDELLTELRPNYDKQVARVNETLHKLKNIIECIPDRPPKSALEAEKEMRDSHGIVVPFPEPRPGKDTKYAMAYAKPTSINVVGSFALRTGMRTADPYTIDLAVTMPASLFQEKDYVNYRYFHKRAFYIACIAAGIKDTKDLKLGMKFDLQDGDSLRPLIVLEPSDDNGNSDLGRSRPRIRIITAVDHTIFPTAKTLPIKNNIRQGIVGEWGDVAEEPTPFYNATLRSEATVSLYHKYLYSVIQKCDSFRDACILGRTWLRQRGFGTSFQAGGFGSFEWAILMALLFEGGGPNGKPILLPSYSSYQIFKATMQFLSGRDLTKPLVFSASGLSFPPGGPVIYDGKRGLNILYKMTPWSYSLLRHEAAVTLKMLNESRYDNFDKVFIVKVNDPMLRFDRLLYLTSPPHARGVLRTLRYRSAVYHVLSRALGNRVRLIFLSGPSVEPWSVKSRPPTEKIDKDIIVGLLLDAENAGRVVDHGPSAEQKEEAASFRAFWGEKAELRRFKDGSILESLVWSDQQTAPSVVRQIVTYILSRHFKIPENAVRSIGDEYDQTLCNWTYALSHPNGEFQLITDAFQSLERSFQEMEGVPLTVRQLSPASPFLRYTALPGRLEGRIPNEPVDVVLQFESSARWPDDIAAIQTTKMAFLVKIGDMLESSGEVSSCRVGLENESSRILNNAFLDIVHTSQVVFRLRIHHDREQTLLERQLKNKELGARAREEIAYALAVYKRLFVQGPRFTQAIRTLCTRFPLLSPTIRLMKHWFNSHLFAPYINEEFVELLTTRAFVHPYPWEPPSSVMAGFLRTLHFLSRWDWQQEPLIVDFGGGLTPEELEGIKTRFAAWRSIDPAMNTVALFAASNIDQDGVTWTQYEMPPKVVAARISNLAKVAVKLLREKGADLDATDIFRSSLAPYDFLIHLSPKHMASRQSTAVSRFKNLHDGNVKDRLAASTAIRSFVQELQASYGHSMLLFHGDEHCNVVAGLWNPQMVTPKRWNLKMAYSTSPGPAIESKGSRDDVTINNLAILNEIARLGGAMVESVRVHNHGGSGI
ncbi:hypothetical protein VTN00DRAFT_7455 [Thermoascus crustaceus]|uniref:uncharacterized protein n=1 Tax=Thermoascus crustaceus TaxID=5088 RepID=UPI0037441971